MIKLCQVTRCFGDKTVLSNLSFSFPDKGVFALMGPSGCGKTTLLRLLAELDKPDGGAIESTHQKIAMAFQEPRLLPWLNCQDNLKLVLSREEEAPEITRNWLCAFELLEVAKQYPSALSGGMKQRLSLARALAFGGDLLLFDEPFSALDRDLKIRIAPFVKEASKEALTILVTHDPLDAELLEATVLELDGSPCTSLQKT